MSTAYEPVPSDSDSQPAQSPQKTGSRLLTIRRLLLFSLTVVVVSLAAYKSEQWTAEKAHLSPGTGSDASSGNKEEDVVNQPPIPAPPSNDTDMSSSGKYSVG